MVLLIRLAEARTDNKALAARVQEVEAENRALRSDFERLVGALIDAGVLSESARSPVALLGAG